MNCKKCKFLSLWIMVQSIIPWNCSFQLFISFKGIWPNLFDASTFFDLSASGPALESCTMLIIHYFWGFFFVAVLTTRHLGHPQKIFDWYFIPSFAAASFSLFFSLVVSSFFWSGWQLCRRRRTQWTKKRQRSRKQNGESADLLRMA